MHPTLLFAILPVLASPMPAAQEPDVRARFVELADKGDRDGVVALWKANPGEVLGVIDADLEGSLAAKEQGAKRDAPEVLGMRRRALFGADCALAAGVDPLLADYVSAFAGFDEAAERRFREGQKAFGAARAAAASQAATSSGGASITLRNRSNWAILSIYLSPVSQTSWGPDQLGANVLHTGETFTLTGVSCDHYDLKLVDEDRDECGLRDVDICHVDAGWTIDNDDLLPC